MRRTLPKPLQLDPTRPHTAAARSRAAQACRPVTKRVAWVVLALLALEPLMVTGQTVSTPGTVSQSIFRSRWAGPQADDLVSRSQGADPDLIVAESQFEQWLYEGIYAGPVRVSPGLSLGWEYSDRQQNNNPTTPGNDSSFFIAPTLALLYDRGLGPWTVTAAYGGGYRYYLNQNYTASGTGSQRNPISQTGSLNIKHEGTRHQFNLKASGSYGTGEDINSGQTTTNYSGSAVASWSYILTDFANVGVEGSTGSSINKYGGNNQDSVLTNYAVSTFLDWLTTGKLRFRWISTAGSARQNINNGAIVSRNFGQTLINTQYAFSEKVLLSGGLGVRYLNDQGVNAQKYTGYAPAFSLAASYAPTEKTAIAASVSLEGYAIAPNFNLSGTWNPRQNTSLSLSIYQNQNFSPNQTEVFQVNRGVSGSIQQKFFSKLSASLSAGYQLVQNLSLSNNVGNPENFGSGFVQGTLRWDFNRWSYWQTTWWSSTGTNYGNRVSNQPETRATVSFNLTF